jgi:cystathionine beta-lyase
VLKRFGVETTYYDPRIGAGIEALIRPNTRAIHIEVPGSVTFDMPDLPAITAVAQRHGIKTIADNTWATPLFFRPLDHGVDIALMAGTKYVAGHSDVMIGTIAANAETWPALHQLHGTLGLCVGPDDINLSLRGLRTMQVRLDRHQASALEIANWLAGRPEVARVLYPGHPSDPGHAIWKRDFKGSSGLLGFVTRPVPVAAVKAMLDGLRLFGLGYSWGGFESLAILSNPRPYRSATSWDDPGHVVRLHMGLVEPRDLIADLEGGFARLRAVPDQMESTDR